MEEEVHDKNAGEIIDQLKKIDDTITQIMRLLSNKNY